MSVVVVEYFEIGHDNPTTLMVGTAHSAAVLARRINVARRVAARLGGTVVVR